MWPTRICLNNPAAVVVAAVLVLILGGLAAAGLPIQLFPDIERPTLGVSAWWPGATPPEVESELVEPMERILRGIPGTEELTVSAYPNEAYANLTFGLEVDMDQAVMDVISRLGRMPPLPDDVDPPVLFRGASGQSAETLIIVFLQLERGNTRPVTDYQPLVDNVVTPQLESVPGVASVATLWGVNAQQVLIEFDPYRAAQLGIEIPAMARAVGASRNASGGFVDIGVRSYALRFSGRYSADELETLVLEWREGRPVRLGDVARVSVALPDPMGSSYQNGNPAIPIQVYRESGANVLEVIEGVKDVMAAFNATTGAENGVLLQPSFDPSVFIYRAIRLLTSNLAIGMTLAIGVLWLFLRQARATLMIAAAIPICLLGTAVALDWAGRTLNIISLAGLAFAVGMVLDAAIVVMESIVRLREGGMSRDDAVMRGTAQVWGALLTSTATTVAIFAPILYLRDVEGQLFADLAVTIAIAIVLSLVVAVTILPTLAHRFLAILPDGDTHREVWKRLAARIVALTDRAAGRWLLIGTMTAGAAVLSWLLLPTTSYLPPVKRDAVDANIAFPAGAAIGQLEEDVVAVALERIAPYFEGEREPQLLNYYFINRGWGGQLGIRARDQSRVEEVQRLITTEILAGIPDIRFFARQGDLFGNFGDSARISVHLQSADQDALARAASRGLPLVNEALPGAGVTVNPDPNVEQPELRFIPKDQRILEAGWTRAEIGMVARALGGGLYSGEYFDGERRLDMILRSESWTLPERLAAMPLATPNGGLQPFGDLVEIVETVGPPFIHRVNGRRTVTLDIYPPEGMPLGEVLDVIERDVTPTLRAALPENGHIMYGGSASGLQKAVRAMTENFLVALGLLFLLMAALFRSPKDAAFVMIALPLATVGGVAALRIINLVTFQPLDLLTMIGFIILLGLVVNNAILLVYQTRAAELGGATRREAVEEALRLRMRPIFMSTLTSIAGMAPLVLFPAAGSVIYRGLAGVIVGGMAVSAVFTLLLLPALMRVGETWRRRQAAHPAAA